MTYESAQDIEYMAMVMLEALRIQPSAPIGQMYTPKKQVTLGKYTFEPGDILSINIEATGHDPEQW